MLVNDKESTIHGLVIFTSWIAILLKVVIMIFVAFSEESILKASLPSKLREKLTAGNNYVAQKDEAQIWFSSLKTKKEKYSL